MSFLSQQAFSFMDRGVVFKIVARYLEAFSNVKEANVSGQSKCLLMCVCMCVCVCVCERERERERERGEWMERVNPLAATFCLLQQLANIKLEFLKIICDHEHFIALNLPFPISSKSSS